MGSSRSAHVVLATSIVVGVAVAGCVDGFTGSNVQIDFSARVGELGPQDPPADTYYTLYAVDQIVDAATGAVTAEHLFEVQRFAIVRAVDLDSPCAIDVEDSPYPGVHVRGFPLKEREVTGVVDPLVQGQDERAVQRVLTADQRLANAGMLQAVKAVASTSIAVYPGVAATCVEDDPGVDAALVPPYTCIGTSSNERRLALCRAVWSVDPLLYAGNDKALTVPHSGELYGFVQGQNPVNGAPLGGSQLFVDEVLDFDAYTINWQFNDRDGDGMPDYPATIDPEFRSPTGFPYVSGFPAEATRGVTNVSMVNRLDPSISAQMAIFADLGDDPVNF
jgi:hypothetical protein